MNKQHILYIILWIASTNCCRKNSDCSDGKYCDGGNIFVSGKCVELREDGKSCLTSILKPFGDGNSCKTKECTCGNCGRLLDNGFDCTTNGNCKSNWCGPEVSLFCTGTCRGKKRNYQECSLEFFDSGDDSSCVSGNCLAVSFTKAVCAPQRGFKEGSQCNEDVDCDKTQNLWCKGGAFYATGRCRQCPARCPDGCNALFNQDLECGRKTLFERIAEELRDIGTAIAHFFECLVPDKLKSCISDAARSTRDCLSPRKPCKIKLGGQGSSCLAVESTQLRYKHREGALRFSGNITSSGTFGAAVDFTNGKIILDFSGSFGINHEMRINTDKKHIQPRISKKLYLTDCTGIRCHPCTSPTESYKCLPKTIYRRAFIIGYLPVIIEIKVQIVAFLDFEMKSLDALHLNLSYNKLDAVKIKNARAVLDFVKGGFLKVSLDKKFNREFVKTAFTRSGVDIMTALRIGPEITFAVNGIPINIFTGIRFAIDAMVPKILNDTKEATCFYGEFMAGLGVDVGIGIDTQEMTVSKLVGAACSAVVNVACYLDKAVNCMAQAIKARKTKFHPCNKMKSFCSSMERKVSSLFRFQLGASAYGTDVQIPVQYFPIKPNGLAVCEESHYQQRNVSATIGSTKLYDIGGGGSKSPQISFSNKCYPTALALCLFMVLSTVMSLV